MVLTEPFIASARAAEALGVGDSALRKARSQGYGMPYVQTESGHVLYRRDDVLAEQRRRIEVLKARPRPPLPPEENA